MAQRISLMGLETAISEYNGWTVGVFGAQGRVVEELGNRRAELGVLVGGLSVETELRSRSAASYFAGLRLGAGRYNLHLVQTDREEEIDDLEDVANIATGTTITSPVWYMEPLLGMRSRLGDIVVLEARLGYSFSMTSGEWRHGSGTVGTAHVHMGGPSVSVGIKIDTF